ncbi:DUF4198 domain-containing protein [Desulfovibrio inopinatus]|uniref:DUF4198 domain-containing protein n=1 Tax=Desulfovibrio inopinatus TaxID=102109 RepID=UPI000405A30F|nr:DUF4198 domain-containing protein [Desulfovibrio inopinatus]
MKKLGMACVMILFAATSAFAHFGMLIPNKDVVEPADKSVSLTLSFSHPFEGVGMDLVKPKVFSVFYNGKQTDLLDTLSEATVMNHKAWKSTYTVKRPGVYRFFMEPTPYWEPAEDVSIIHYTQTIVSAFGDEEGWSEPLGVKTEIVPLTRPFASRTGFVFTGRVLLNGKPVPNAEVEVEYYNAKNTITAPNDHHVTYVVHADDSGVFTFACPQPGWWGFAALNEGDFTIKDPEGKDKPVELGAVLWVQMTPWNTK